MELAVKVQEQALHCLRTSWRAPQIRTGLQGTRRDAAIARSFDLNPADESMHRVLKPVGDGLDGHSFEVATGGMLTEAIQFGSRSIRQSCPDCKRDVVLALGQILWNYLLEFC